MTMIKLNLIYLTYENTIFILMHANFKSLESYCVELKIISRTGMR